MFKFIAFAASAYGAGIIRAKEPVSGSYIVVFKQGIAAAAVSGHMDAVRGRNMTVKFEYNINNDFVGYHTIGHKTEKALDFVLNHEAVDFIEEDGMMYTAESVCTGTTQKKLESGLWGLSRTSSAIYPTNNYKDYTYQYTGSGVVVYVLDTGIRTTHVEFGGRASFGFDATGEGAGDSNGHGTHVASTIGGTNFGIAKDASLVAVKVLGASGAGSTAGIISGVDYMVSCTGTYKKVGSLSLGGGFSTAMNNAVDSASRTGISMVVASGNSNTDACNFSPASAPLAITVNSIAMGDVRSSFSNFGNCTDIFAPGSSVLGAWSTSNTASYTISGTSMSCPFVAGQVAKLFQEDSSLTSADVKATLIGDAGTGVINPGFGSPDRILYGC